MSEQRAPGTDLLPANDTLTGIPGLRVGHWTDAEGQTGCTVALCDPPARAGVDVRGGGPGTRETDLLDPSCSVDRVDAICLAGGSAFGLAAADGVMRWLAERGRGFDAGVARVPIVPAAILFDLAVGDPSARPGPEAGYAACEAASDAPVAQGRVGAGRGATVGTWAGPERAAPGGLGSALLRSPDGARVAALAAVNALGSIRDPRDGRWLAGPPADIAAPDPPGFGHTTLVILATDARLDAAGCAALARAGNAGLCRVIQPAHGPYDGDTVFALSTGDLSAEPHGLSAVAAEAVSAAILRAVR